MNAVTGFKVTGVLARAIGLYVRNLNDILPLSLAIYAPAAFISMIFVPPGTEAFSMSPIALPVLVPGFVCLCWLQAALIYCLIVRMRSNRFPQLAESLGYSLKILPVLIPLTFVLMLAVYVGLMFFIVPGLLLAALCWVAVPALVVEECGPLTALRRSRHLTSGNRLRICGLCALTLLITVALSGLGSVLANAVGQNAILFWLLTWVTVMLTNGIWNTILAVSYHDLRLLAESEGGERTGTVDQALNRRPGRIPALRARSLPSRDARAALSGGTRMTNAVTGFSAVGVLARAFGLYVRNLPRILLLSLTLCAPAVLLPMVFVPPRDFMRDPADPLFLGLTVGAGWICLDLLTAALIHCLFARMADKPFPPLVEALGHALRVFPGLFLLGALLKLVVLAGLIVLIVPGLVLAAVFWVAIPALTLERRGLPDALRRSRHLTSGNRVRICGLAVLTGLILVVTSELGLVLPEAVWQSAILFWLLSSIPNVLVFGFWVALVVVSYRDLRLLAGAEGGGERPRSADGA